MHAPCLCKGRRSVTVIEVQTSFSLIFAQRECQVKENKISNATPGLGAMHAICPVMLGPLAFNEKKDKHFFMVIRSRLYLAADSHSCRYRAVSLRRANDEFR